MIQAINIAVNLAAFMLSGMLLIAALLGGNLHEKVFRWFFVIVLITCVGALGDTVIMVLWGTAGSTVYTIVRVIDFFNYGAMGVTLVAIAMYFYEFFCIRNRPAKAFVTFHIILAVLVTVLVVVAQFVPVISWLDENNNYQKGSLFWLFQLFPSLSLVACVALTLTNLAYLRRREWVALLLYVVTPVICYVLETALADIWLTYFGSALALLMIYINIQLELRHRLIENEAELAEGRIALLLSQIQPHFIFNTLSSISDVCEDNPLAQQSLITFSEYLRVNMDALSQKTPVPFEQELAHVRQYLWLEQLRFEEKLSVTYDIQEDRFMLPVLTIQPIVENAVRHGITRKATAGKVWIATERVAQGVRIVIRDDGVGFDPASPRPAGRSHVGLENVRTRLAELCGGSLSVQSAPRQGTTVVISIPEQGRQTK